MQILRKPFILRDRACGRRRAIRIGMILVITPSANIQSCIPAIQEASGESVQVTTGLRPATLLLRTQEYSAVVFDQVLMDADPDESEIIMQYLGAAIPIHVNFAITGAQRLVRELRMGLQRRKREVKTARAEAEKVLRSELKGNVTAMLLSCEMALGLPDLPAGAEEKLQVVHGLAEEIRVKLGAAE